MSARRAVPSFVVTLGLVLGAVLVPGAGCTASRSDAPAAAFELVCDSADTEQSSTLFCMRIDTRDGDIRYVDLSKLTQSNGPTKAGTAAAGTYTLVCDSTNTSTKSDFRCLRLNRFTGELLLVNLPRLGKTPE